MELLKIQYGPIYVEVPVGRDFLDDLELVKAILDFALKKSRETVVRVEKGELKT